MPAGSNPRSTDVTTRGLYRRLRHGLLVLPGVLLLALIGGHQGLLDDAAATPSEANGAVPFDPYRRSVTALGRLEPRGQVIDIGAPADESVAELLAAEGDWVERGQPLCRLESHDLALAELALASVAYDEAVKRRDAERGVFRTLTEEGNLAVRRAKELAPLQLEAQAARLRSIDAQLEAAHRAESRLVAMGDAVTERELLDSRLEVRTLDEERQTVSSDLAAMTVEGDIRVSEAVARLERYRAEQARADVIHSIQSREKEVALAEARVDRSIIRAPVEGEVLRLMVFAGERVGDQPILKLGDVREMHAVAEVYETDIRWVAVGQPATISSPALPRPLQGVVASIGQLVFKNDVLDVDPAVDIDARVVEVRIRLDADELASRLTNLQVDVEIHVSEASNEEPAAGR